MITIYTDGSCKGNPGPGGFGVVVIESWDIPEHGNIIEAHSEQCSDTTNNREEMKAIIYALEHYGDLVTPVIVYSDSAYCVNSFTNWIHGWKANGWKRAGNKKLENLDLIQKYDELINQGLKIDLRKIKGHAGETYNELADDLATGKKTREQALKECQNG